MGGSHRHSNHCNFSLLLTLLLAFAAVFFHFAAAETQRWWLGTPLGPGSSPPTCRSRCGRCWPCQPVHVPIQPGMSVPLEYYPEAWRCKCGNKLFMP
ncbi:EPIDERMAL PATTERNING FACTOR-like protein 4, partial [Cucurbita argyrosperma subsp. sororia]